MKRLSEQELTLDVSQAGKGNWEEFPGVPLETVHEAAAEWRRALAGVTRPWLCWNVSERWGRLQQRLIQEVGWTPVVGYDPRCGPPAAVLPGSILIDFNSHFGFEVMWPHFPLEFAFLFTDRLAFLARRSFCARLEGNAPVKNHLRIPARWRRDSGPRLRRAAQLFPISQAQVLGTGGVYHQDGQ